MADVEQPREPDLNGDRHDLWWAAEDARLRASESDDEAAATVTSCGRTRSSRRITV